MKVLIETITNRKGYKFFENKEEMDAYLGRHCGDMQFQLPNDINRDFGKKMDFISLRERSCLFKM